MKKWSIFILGSIFFCLMTGCATQQPKRDLIVLLPDPDGKVGTITVTTDGGSQVINKPGYSTEVENLNKTPTSPRQLNENEIKDIFASALSAQPDLSNRFLLFILFFENDSTKLTRESKDIFSEALKNIKTRNSNEVYVVGHTDLVGTESYNKELSSKRASYIRNLFVSSGIKPGTLFVSYYGKSRPLVSTEDETPEPRNRRVEVIIR
ncbi:MAG: OmpA family protein [Deltaproteobacteria bacterium]|nr:OmpA family protein [Deltaproteobacteria bacterium]